MGLSKIDFRVFSGGAFFVFVEIQYGLCYSELYWDSFLNQPGIAASR